MFLRAASVNTTRCACTERSTKTATRAYVSEYGIQPGENFKPTQWSRIANAPRIHAVIPEGKTDDLVKRTQVIVKQHYKEWLSRQDNLEEQQQKVLGDMFCKVLPGYANGPDGTFKLDMRLTRPYFYERDTVINYMEPQLRKEKPDVSVHVYRAPKKAGKTAAMLFPSRNNLMIYMSCKPEDQDVQHKHVLGILHEKLSLPTERADLVRNRRIARNIFLCDAISRTAVLKGWVHGQTPDVREQYWIKYFLSASTDISLPVFKELLDEYDVTNKDTRKTLLEELNIVIGGTEKLSLRRALRKPLTVITAIDDLDMGADRFNDMLVSNAFLEGGKELGMARDENRRGYVYPMIEAWKTTPILAGCESIPLVHLNDVAPGKRTVRPVINPKKTRTLPFFYEGDTAQALKQYLNWDKLPEHYLASAGAALSGELAHVYRFIQAVYETKAAEPSASDEKVVAGVLKKHGIDISV